jgi:hypothetical protein
MTVRFAGTIVAGVVALFAIVTAAVVGGEMFGNLGSEATPLLVSLIAVASAAIPSLITLARVEQVKDNLQNGLIPAKTTEAIVGDRDTVGSPPPIQDPRGTL